MDQIVVFQKPDLTVGRILSDFLKDQQSLLKPQIKEGGEVFVQVFQIQGRLPLGGQEVYPKIQKKFQPSRKIEEGREEFPVRGFDFPA
jgi:hypothetical protein